MLVLSRNVSESIHISDDIVITILGDLMVRLESESMPPKDVPVHRSEVYERILADKG